MTTFAPPIVAWRGTLDDERPLVVLLRGRGSNEADIVALTDHLPDGLAYARCEPRSPRAAATPGWL